MIFSLSFTSVKDIRKKCNLIMNLSKFTSNKNILSSVVAIDFKQFGAKFCPNGCNLEIFPLYGVVTQQTFQNLSYFVSSISLFQYF